MQKKRKKRSRNQGVETLKCRGYDCNEWYAVTMSTEKDKTEKAMTTMTDM